MDSQQHLRITLSFSVDDQAWLRRSQIAVPKFWAGHGVAPLAGDALRIGGRQFIIQARIWEHDAEGPLLRLFIGSSHAESDTVFG